MQIWGGLWIPGSRGGAKDAKGAKESEVMQIWGGLSIPDSRSGAKVAEEGGVMRILSVAGSRGRAAG